MQSTITYKEIKKLLDELLKNDREIKKELKKLSPYGHLLDGWFPANAVKDMLCISNSTLHRYMNDGTLAYSKIGSRTLFNQKDIFQLLDQNYRKGS